MVGVQYHGGYHDACEGYLEYCGGYLEYCGGYLEYCGGYSVLWTDIMMHVGGYHEYHTIFTRWSNFGHQALKIWTYYT